MKKKSLLKRFVAYYKPYKLLFALDMSAAFLVAVIGMAYPMITRYMLNDLIPNNKTRDIIIFGSALLIIYIVRYALRWFIQYYGHVMGVAMQAQMRSDLFAKIEKLPYTFFDEHETGKIMTRMTNDLFEIGELAHHGPENIFIASFTIIGAFVYLLTIQPVLATICVVMVPILFGISFLFRKSFRNAFRESRKAQAAINASVESSISGVRVTKAYTNEKRELDKFEKSNTQFVTARRGVLSHMARYLSTSQFVTDIFNVVVLIAGGLFLNENIINFADYSAFMVSISLFIAPINQLIQFMEQLQDGASGFNRFIEIIDEEEESDTGDKILENVKGSIAFEDVCFSYKTSGRDIINHVSFSINPGDKVALVGPTGGGKTTICHLLPRFYEFNGGLISIDGQNIQEIKLSSLRQNIGIVQQDVFLFGGTIKENISYGKGDATDEEIIDAAKKANLWDFISALPNGLDTEIGERGVKLSGGQKQRISIARVFLKDPAILILDEATSALDNTTEFLIQQALDELCKNRTTIVVAHRLSTVKNANKILVISQGEIIESGSHDELMERGGVYRSLYRLQFRDNDEDRVEISSELSIG